MKRRGSLIVLVLSLTGFLLTLHLCLTEFNLMTRRYVERARCQAEAAWLATSGADLAEAMLRHGRWHAPARLGPCRLRTGTVEVKVRATARGVEVVSLGRAGNCRARVVREIP